MNKSLVRNGNNWSELARRANWSVKQLAATCNVSVRTLHRHFINETGKNTKCWLIEERQKQATELLRAGYSVKKAAICLGYKQPANFTRSFKSYWGLAPSQYGYGDNLFCSELEHLI